MIPISVLNAQIIALAAMKIYVPSVKLASNWTRTMCARKISRGVQIMLKLKMGKIPTAAISVVTVTNSIQST